LRFLVNKIIKMAEVTEQQVHDLTETTATDPSQATTISTSLETPPGNHT